MIVESLGDRQHHEAYQRLTQRCFPRRYRDRMPKVEQISARLKSCEFRLKLVHDEMFFTRSLI